MNSAKLRVFWVFIVVSALGLLGGIGAILWHGDSQAPMQADEALLRSNPGNLRVHYRPMLPPADLDDPKPTAPTALLQRWFLDPEHFKGPLAWCPSTGLLAFYREGWVWVTDAQGSRLRTLWYEPDLAAAGKLAWSQNGKQLWIRADGWRHWLSLELGIDGR